MVTWGKEGTVSRSINVLSFHNGGVYENLGVCFTIFLLINFIYLFIYFWLHCVFIAARGLSLFVASSSCSPLQCVGLSAWWPLSLQSTGSKHAGVSSCGVWAQLLCGTWDPPDQGLNRRPPHQQVDSQPLPPGKSPGLFVFLMYTYALYILFYG